MIKFINSWVQGIIIAVIISTIIEMILPDGNIKKYIRTVIGSYIVFVIASPIITKLTGKEISLETYKLPEIETYQVGSIDTNSYIESTYIDKIKQEIKTTIEEKGYSAIKVDIEIETGDENYGNIQKINLLLTSETIQENKIKPIEINIEKNVEREEETTNEEFEELKQELKETYGTPLENIYIRREE